MQRSFTQYGKQSLQLPLRLMMLCWMITKWICLPVWFATRNFPMLPVHNVLLKAPALLHAGLFWISAAAIVVLIFFPLRKIAAVLFFVEILSCLLDQSRWQPWEYQFILMTAAYIFIQKKEQLLLAWQLILAAVYFFSGLSKLQPAFIHDIWDGLILRSWLHIFNDSAWLARLGYTIPLGEMLAAILLFFVRTRKPAIILLAGMHLLMLAMLGPLGTNLYMVLWPWNVLMIILLFILYWKNAMQWSGITLRKPVFVFLIILCWILPFLRLVNRWDRNLSFNYLSGGVPQLYVCTEEKPVLFALSPYMTTFSNSSLPCRFPVSVSNWSMQEIKLVTYPQERSYLEIARQLKEQFPKADIRFYLYYPGFKSRVEPLKD